MEPRGNGRTADEGAASAVGFERAPNDQRLAGFRLDALLGQHVVSRMTGWELDLGRHRSRILAVADQPGVSARAKCQAQGIEQD
jgi:hypothetical protein